MSSYPQYPLPEGHMQPPAPMYPVYKPVPPPPAEPLEYHRLTRTYATYRWWKPLMVGLIALGLFIGMTVLATVVFMFAAMSNPAMEQTFDEMFMSEDIIDIDMSDPGIFAFSMVSIILMLPTILIATRIMNVQKVGSLTSVTGKMRWGWLGKCMLVAAAILTLSLTLSFAVDSAGGIPFEPDFAAPNMWILLFLTVLLVPFQATAEEYVFRGYLMQLLGSWLRHPAFAILIPVPFFMAGHMYDIYGQLDVGFFAVAAGWLAWRTGGLEAAIALHVVNNSVIFVLGAIGLVDVSSTESNLPSLIASIITTVIYVAVVVRLANKNNIERRSTPPAPLVYQTPQYYWQQPQGWGPPPSH